MEKVELGRASYTNPTFVNIISGLIKNLLVLERGQVHCLGSNFIVLVFLNLYRKHTPLVIFLNSHAYLAHWPEMGHTDELG